MANARRTMAEIEDQHARATDSEQASRLRADARALARKLQLPAPAWAAKREPNGKVLAEIEALEREAPLTNAKRVPPELEAWRRRKGEGAVVHLEPDGAVILRRPDGVRLHLPTLAAACAAVA